MPLTTTSANALATSIAVVGNTGYNSAMFWRNDIGFILDNTISSANAILVTN